MRAWLSSLAVLGLSAFAFADGNVAGVVSGRTLTLTGDAGSNWIAVAPGGATDALRVTPANGTTLNGGGAVTFPKVRNVVIAMGAGADHVEFDGTKIRGFVKADLGDGDDQLYFLGSQIRGRVFVKGGAGSDLVRSDSSAVFYGPMRIEGGDGNDEIQLTNATFRNRLRVEAGGDDDHVLLQGAVCGNQARVEIAAARGLDFVELQTCQFANDVWVDCGPDDDRVRVNSCRFAMDLSAFGGAGADDVLAVEGGNVFVRLQDFGGFEEGQPR